MYGEECSYWHEYAPEDIRPHGKFPVSCTVTFSPRQRDSYEISKNSRGQVCNTRIVPCSKMLSMPILSSTKAKEQYVRCSTVPYKPCATTAHRRTKGAESTRERAKNDERT